MEPVAEMRLEVLSQSDAIHFQEVDGMISTEYNSMPLDSATREEFEIETFDMKPMEIEISADDTNKDIEDEFHAVIEGIKSEGICCDDSKPVVDSNEAFIAICRLCANRGNRMIDMFEGSEEYENILEKIEDCLTVVVRRTDTLTKYACRMCLDKLDFCYEFNRAVMEADKQLSSSDERMSSEVEMKEERHHSQTYNVQEITTAIDDNGNTIQVEATDSPDPESEGLLASRNDTEEDNETLDSWSASDVVDSDRQIVDRGKIVCRICGIGFKTVEKCHVHSSIHAHEYYYPCGICDETFTTEEECNEHNLEHVDKGKAERSSHYACDECGKKFITKDRLEFHKNCHNSAEPFYCDKCDKTMTSESVLYRHVVNVHRQYKEYCCEICGKLFRTEAELTADQRKHNEERPFDCEICGKRFYAKDILSRHKKLHLSHKSYQCDQCGKRFNRQNSLKKHLLNHEAEAGNSANCQVCNICKEVFADVQTANEHLENCSISGKTKNRKIVVSELKEIYRCEYCQRCFTEIAFVKNHKTSHSDPLPYVCVVCDTRYSTYSRVAAHRVAHKKSSKMKTFTDGPRIPKYFICDYCDKKYLHFTNMNVHRRSCLKKKIFTCGNCGDTFDNGRELSKHKRGNDKVKKLSCNGCCSTFGSKCDLEIHKKTHSTNLRERRGCSCSYCGKTFFQKSHLTIHVRSHTGERPYSCDLCEKTYKIKSERDDHRRTHSGDKPFKCSVCDKSFANTARLREHMRFHNGNRPYNCHLCDQSFKKSNARKMHMIIHSGEKPYQCDVCGTDFRRSGDMRRHKRIKHGNEFVYQSGYDT